MKTFFTIIFTIISILPGNAQTRKIDSLNNLIARAKTDTERIKLKYDKIELLSKVNLDSALNFGKKTLIEAKKINYYKGVNDIIQEMVVDFCFKGDFKSAKENLEFLKRYIKSGDSVQVARIYAGYGLMYGVQSKYDTSVQFLEKAIGIWERHKDSGFLRSAYQNVAIGYAQTSNLPRALFYQQKALSLSEKKNDLTQEAYSYLNMGITYDEMEDTARAEQSYLQAVELAKKKQLNNVELYAYSNLATLYVTEKKWQKGYEFALKAVALGAAMGDQGIQAASLAKAAVAMSQLKRFTEAMALGQKAIAVADSSRQPLDIFQAYAAAGSVLKDQGKYKEAIPYYEKGFSSLQDADVYDLGIGLNFQELSECYEKTGDFSKSLAAYKRYSAISDSVRSKDNTRKTTELTMNAEFDKKQAVQNEEQAKKDAVALERQLLLLVGFALTLIIACVAFYAFRSKQKDNRIIKAEKKRSDDLLLNILPAETAEELKNTGTAKAKSFDEVTVMFTDFKNFTKASEKMSAEELVKEINYCYSSFDSIISKYGIEKIKTIGDSYMCAGGLPVRNRTHPGDVIKAAMEIRDFILNHQRERAEKGEVPFEMRIGIHTGPIVAGIVGIKKFAYDIWGDTVNIASRMEQSGEPGQVNISGDTYALVKTDFRCVFRGKIAAKNKPDMDMYFVEGELN